MAIKGKEASRLLAKYTFTVPNINRNLIMASASPTGCYPHQKTFNNVFETIAPISVI